jgi:YD repeat-containing protein
MGPLGAWDGREVRLGCPVPIDAFELPAWPECHEAQAIAGVGGLCPGGGQRCMRPCRLDVLSGDHGDLVSRASFEYDDAGRLAERRVDGLLPAEPPDGAADHVNRWVYSGGRLVRVEELRPGAEDAASDAAVTQWSSYRYDGEGRVEAIESHRASRAGAGAAPGRSVASSVTSFRRDRAGRIVERRVDDRFAARIERDAAGRIVELATEVVRIRYVYEPGSSRLVRTEQRLLGASEPDVETLTYSERGQVLSVETTRPAARSRVAYEYDADGRLVAERPGDPSGAVLLWVYDCAE